MSGAVRRRIAICPPKKFSALVREAGRRALADDAAYALSRAEPRLSACAPQLRWSNFFFIIVCIGLIAGVMAVWRNVFDIVSLILSSLFYGGIYVRLCATVASSPDPSAPQTRPLRDADLPTYTIIAPMHREAAVAAQFVAALRALDYPAAKLDIKFVIEEDDAETFAALHQAGLAPYMEVVVAPAGAPRTKPRALNVALPLARGELLTIFDAEDRPEPLQLRIAAERFAVSPPNVACLQARIAIDNGHESWLAYFFSISYAALFDVINPGLGELGLPMPLGGTSNHFRTALLRRMVGWDAWNVTEDADLGLRFARFGYEVHAIDAATYEDAPVTLSAWLGQRSRWMKGWMRLVRKKHITLLNIVFIAYGCRFSVYIATPSQQIIRSCRVALRTHAAVLPVANFGSLHDASTDFTLSRLPSPQRRQRRPSAVTKQGSPGRNS